MESESDPAPRAALVVGVVFEAALVGVALGLGALLGVNPLATFRLDAGGAVLGLLAALPLVGLFALFLRHPVGPLRRIRQALDEHLLPILRHASALDLFALAALAGLGEEMLFRGVAQAWATTELGEGAGLFTASVLFGLAHALTPAYAAIAACIGALLGWLWTATGNLLAPAVAHAAYDFAALLLYVRSAGRPPQ